MARATANTLLRRVPLLGSAYKNRSYIASAQRCVNLYPETNPDPQSPVPVTHYQTPGSQKFAQTPVVAKTRCTYRTTIGTAYIVVGPNVYLVASNGATVLIGVIADRPSQVIMADNGLSLVMVDGQEGWAINLATNAFGKIIDPSFYGASHVAFLDTFYVFNRPNTNQFYISLSMVTFAMLTGGTAFDPLDITAKAGNADNIVALAAVHRELWLIGVLTTEVWAGTGAADFYFQVQQGAFIDHGCIAEYSMQSQDAFLIWLMQDKQGKCIVVQGGGYQVKEISTPAIVEHFQSFAVVNDAVGYCFQIDDHSYYCLAFATQDETWVFDLKTGEWFEWTYTDSNGVAHRHRSNCAMFAHNRNLVGDHSKGIVWELRSDLAIDGNADDPLISQPIVRIRTFPHMLNNGARAIYDQFIIDMTTGIGPQLTEDEPPPQVSLRWSDNRGKSYGNPVLQSAGKEGDYLKQISYNRLGMARDRVFEVSWSIPDPEIALNGAWVKVTPLPA